MTRVATVEEVVIGLDWLACLRPAAAVPQRRGPPGPPGVPETPGLPDAPVTPAGPAVPPRPHVLPGARPATTRATTSAPPAPSAWSDPHSARCSVARRGDSAAWPARSPSKAIPMMTSSWMSSTTRPPGKPVPGRSPHVAPRVPPVRGTGRRVMPAILRTPDLPVGSPPRDVVRPTRATTSRRTPFRPR